MAEVRGIIKNKQKTRDRAIMAVSGAINRQNIAISGAINRQKGRQILYLYYSYFTILILLILFYRSYFTFLIFKSAFMSDHCVGSVPRNTITQFLPSL